jgi:hypothetical protein
MTGRLPDLVAELVVIAAVPVLSARYEIAEAGRRVAFEAPWAEAVQRVLETTTAPHRPGFVGEKLGLTREEESRVLELLTAAHLVRFDGQRYVPLPPSTVDTGGGKRALIALKKHWSLVAAERIDDPRPGDLFAYNVVSVSADDLERIRARLHAAFREIRAIVAASEPSERVALVNLQLVTWD